MSSVKNLESSFWISSVFKVNVYNRLVINSLLAYTLRKTLLEGQSDCIKNRESETHGKVFLWRSCSLSMLYELLQLDNFYCIFLPVTVIKKSHSTTIIITILQDSHYHGWCLYFTTYLTAVSKRRSAGFTLREVQ